MTDTRTRRRGRTASVALRAADVQAVARHCRRTFPVRDLEPPGGYAGLGLCVLHAIYALRSRELSAVNVVERYCAWAGIRPKPLGTGGPEHNVAQLHAAILEVGVERFAAEVVRHRQPTSPVNGVLKAQACLEAAEVLLDHRIRTRAQLRHALPAPDARLAWCAVPGQTSGISWHHMLTLAGVTGACVDRMVMRFVGEALGRTVSEPEAESLLGAAHGLLRVRAPGLDLRTLDHAIWEHERRR